MCKLAILRLILISMSRNVNLMNVLTDPGSIDAQLMRTRLQVSHEVFKKKALFEFLCTDVYKRFIVL